MPNAKIRTYGSINIGGIDVKVDTITSEDPYVADIEKEVSFGKFSKKLPLNARLKDVDRGRE